MDPLAPAISLARIAGTAARSAGRGGTSLPGRVLLRLAPEAIAKLAARLPRGSVIISATNGKTTTAAMAASILGRAGVTLVHNRAGANMAGGIATALLSAARGPSRMTGDLGLFEVDEAWLAPLTRMVAPRAILLANLHRDQLDRFGELEAIAERWRETAVAGPGARAQLILCADDPLVADLGRGRDAVFYYGLGDDSMTLDGLAHAADSKQCRACGADYVYDAVYLGHLGSYRCEACGQSRPPPAVRARSIELHGVHSAKFELHTPEGSVTVRLPLPGLYNVYNALAAAALAHALGVDLATTAAALEAFDAVFGRAERVLLDGRELRIMLVKNPTGANEVLRTLALEPGQHDLLVVLNDNIADGRDVSWIWDVDFEPLAEHVRCVVCAGTRASELALRLRYAGIERPRLRIVPDLDAALSAALADGDDAEGDRKPLYALPTYTAMLSLRELLAARGATRSAFE